MKNFREKLAALPIGAVAAFMGGEIKGLWILCTNPRHSWANSETFRTAAEKLELFMVQDIYDDTDSAQLATVFLPVVPGIKKKVL